MKVDMAGETIKKGASGQRRLALRTTTDLRVGKTENGKGEKSELREKEEVPVEQPLAKVNGSLLEHESY